MNDILLNHEALLLHCLGTYGGVSHPETVHWSPYRKMKQVIENQPRVSCLTVRPGDDSRRNMFGPIGLIIKNAKCLKATPIDGGTLSKDRDDLPNEEIPREELIAAIEGRCQNA